MAEAIGPVVGLEPVTDRRLRERHYGVFQGLTLAEMADRHPAALARYMAHNPDYAIPEGESISDRLHRSSEFLQEVVSRHPGRTIIVITHGGVLDGWLRLGLGLGLNGERSFGLPNAGINLLRADDSGWIADVWADVSHLPDGFWAGACFFALFLVVFAGVLEGQIRSRKICA